MSRCQQSRFVSLWSLKLDDPDPYILDSLTLGVCGIHSQLAVRVLPQFPTTLACCDPSNFLPFGHAKVVPNARSLRSSWQLNLGEMWQLLSYLRETLRKAYYWSDSRPNITQGNITCAQEEASCSFLLVWKTNLHLRVHKSISIFFLEEEDNDKRITTGFCQAFKLLLGMQSMVSAGGGGGDGKSADDVGFLLWNFEWTLHAFDILWAAPGRDAILKVMDATAASIQDKLPKPFAHLWHGYCIHNSTQKISKVEMRLYDLSGLMYASWSFLHSTRTPTSAEIQSCPLMSCIQEKSSLPTIAWTTEQVASRHYTHRFWTRLLPRFWRCSRIPQQMVFFLHEFFSVLKPFLLNLLASVVFLSVPLFEASACLISLALLFVSAFSSSANRLLLLFVSRLCCVSPSMVVHYLSSFSSAILAQKTQC